MELLNPKALLGHKPICELCYLKPTTEPMAEVNLKALLVIEDPKTHPRIIVTQDITTDGWYLNLYLFYCNYNITSINKTSTPQGTMS